MASNRPQSGPLSVLYVEDDERLGRLTAQYLESHGLRVELCRRGDEAISAVARLAPDVVLLDLMLPGLDGLDVCRQLRARYSVPILMVTARGEEADRVMGLEDGADDYVSKPFSSRELLARIRAQVRRAQGRVGPAANRLVAGDLTLDPASMMVTRAGKVLQLTTLEFTLLKAFLERPGRVLDRDQLLELVHKSADEAFDRSIDVHVSRLRQKLGDDARNPRLLRTIRGAGYMFTPGVE